jgi:hypothetical protein
MTDNNSWIVVYEYSDSYDNIFFGPFATALEAETWMNEQPDDEDLIDMFVACMNHPSTSDNRE